MGTELFKFHNKFVHEEYTCGLRAVILQVKEDISGEIELWTGKHCIFDEIWFEE